MIQTKCDLPASCTRLIFTERVKRDACSSPSGHPRQEDEIWWRAQEASIVSIHLSIFKTVLSSGAHMTASKVVAKCTCVFRSLRRNGYQKFSQEMLSNGELNHLPMKERMAEIGGRWQRLPQKEKDRYKKIAEEKQRLYKVQLEQWLAVSITTCHTTSHLLACELQMSWILVPYV